jgi:hypothetical protein
MTQIKLTSICQNYCAAWNGTCTRWDEVSKCYAAHELNDVLIGGHELFIPTEKVRPSKESLIRVMVPQQATQSVG